VKDPSLSVEKGKLPEYAIYNNHEEKRIFGKGWNGAGLPQAKIQGSRERFIWLKGSLLGNQEKERRTTLPRGERRRKGGHQEETQRERGKLHLPQKRR